MHCLLIMHHTQSQPEIPDGWYKESDGIQNAVNRPSGMSTRSINCERLRKVVKTNLRKVVLQKANLRKVGICERLLKQTVAETKFIQFLILVFKQTNLLHSINLFVMDVQINTLCSPTNHLCLVIQNFFNVIM